MRVSSRKDVCKGRATFLSQFPSMADTGAQALLTIPPIRTCSSDRRWIMRNAIVPRTRRLSIFIAICLRLRRETPAFRAQTPRGLDGAVLSGRSSGGEALVLRYFDAAGDRLVLMNLGRDLALSPASDPLIAPLEDMDWAIEWSSEDPKYGGGGTPPLDVDQWPGAWKLPGESLIVLAPGARLTRRLKESG